MAHQAPPRKTVSRPPIPMQQTGTSESTSQTGAPEPARKVTTLAEAGFVAPALIIRPTPQSHHRLMLSLEGDRGGGKSEFADSAPGPVAHLVLDRGIDSVLDNPEPPPTRSENVLYKVIRVPKASQLAGSAYLEYWKAYHRDLLNALDSTDGRTVVMDGDPDSWELQRLAEFGRLTKVPPLMYDQVNAARRALYARCYDSGKIVIGTARVRKVYADKRDHNGNVILKDDGNPVREWTGEFEKQGFADGGYVWTIQCFCFYDAERQEFGIRIRECKVNKRMNGMELRGQDCNFASLVSMVYPHISLEEWGY